jgi:hypothetical protein
MQDGGHKNDNHMLQDLERQMEEEQEMEIGVLRSTNLKIKIQGLQKLMRQTQ